MKRVCVLGSNSGRNAGDAAILSSIIRNLSARHPDIRFDVPTTRPDYLYEKFGRERVRAVSMMPWTGSLRLLGLPTLYSIARSDAVLITDGIIFDVKLFNPLFNFLILLVFLVPFARLFRREVVCFLVGIGPLESFWGKRMGRLVCRLCDRVMAREEDSAELVRSLGVDPARVGVYADAAFVNEPAPPERGLAILRHLGLSRSRPIVALNINSYADRWLARGEKLGNPEEFKGRLASAFDRLVGELNCQVLLIGTQVMDSDYAAEVLERCGHSDSIRNISNADYTPEEIMAVLGHVNVFAGMRLHSIILASAMGTPCIGLVYAPKVRQHMRLLGFADFAIELKGFKPNHLVGKVGAMLKEEAKWRAVLGERLVEIKADANRGFDELVRSLEGGGF